MDPAEAELFGDLVPLVHRDSIALMRWKLSKSYPPEGVRFIAWLFYREADLQMTEGNPGLAIAYLNEGIGALTARRSVATPSDSKTLARIDAVIDLWTRRRDEWSQVVTARLHGAGLARTAAQVESLPEGLLAADLWLQGGLSLLSTASRLEASGYAVLAHHILHHDGAERALAQASRLYADADQPERKETADRAYEDSRRLHVKTHDAIYWSDPWMPIRAEDGRHLLRPNVVLIRRMANAVASWLGLPQPDPIEILEAVRDDERLLPVEEAVRDLELLRVDLEEVSSPGTLISASLDLYDSIENFLSQGVGDAPHYLRTLWHGFTWHLKEIGRGLADTAAAGGAPFSDIEALIELSLRDAEALLVGKTRRPLVETDTAQLQAYLNGIRFLMRTDSLDLAHDLVVKLEKDTDASELTELHQELHILMDRVAPSPESENEFPFGSQDMRDILARMLLSIRADASVDLG